jgi:hypothetical protein
LTTPVDAVTISLARAKVPLGSHGEGVMRVYAGKGGSAMLEMAAFEYSTEPGVYTIEHRTCTGIRHPWRRERQLQMGRQLLHWVRVNR